MRSGSTHLNRLLKSKLEVWGLLCALLLIGSSIYMLGSVSASFEALPNRSRVALAKLLNVFQSSESEQEPNETIEQANPLALPGQVTGKVKYGDAADFEYVYSNGPKDKIEDLFKFTIPNGSSRQIEIVLTFSDPVADLDLFLFRVDNGKLSAIRVSNSSTTTERITPPSLLDPGTYYIGVSAFDDPGNTTEANYILSVAFVNNAQLPLIASINPGAIAAGSGPFPLTVNGRFFVNGQSVVRWNGENRSTTFVNETQLVALITAADIAVQGTAPITVFNSGPQGGQSNAVNFQILSSGDAEPEVEPNETSQQANLLLVPGKRRGTVAIGDAASITLNSGKDSSDQIEDVFAISLAESSRLDLLLTGANSNADLALYLLKEAESGQLSVVASSREGGAVQRIITPAVLAPGRYLVGVSSVTGSSNYFIEAKIPGDRLLQILTSSAANNTVNIPLIFNSEGDENFLSFSLSFNPVILNNPQISLGSDAATAALSINNTQLAQGRVGVQIDLPAGQKFSAGKREVLKVNFGINAGAGTNTTPVNFTDQPVVRQIVDYNNNAVIGSYASGAVVLTAGFEADVSPRPTGNGDGTVTTADWTQVGRFVAGLDTPADGSEFQRVDCAPKSTLGDGRLTIADWVLAGLYAAGLETPVPAGGPVTLASTLSGVEKSFQTLSIEPSIAEQGRAVRIKETIFQRGEDNDLFIELVSEGNENAIGCSLNFDITQLAFIRASLGPDAAGAILNINTNKLTEGRIGLSLALPSGQKFTTGIRQIVKLTFNVPRGNSVNSTTISFGDIPIAREIVDATAAVLPAVYTPGNIAVNPPINQTPSLTSLDPSTVIVGSPSFTLTVNGSNFVNGAVVLANGVARATSFVGDTQLRAVIPAQDLDEVGTLNFTVQNPPPGGGVSNALGLPIINPLPTLTALNPNAAAVGDRGLTLTAIGTNFVPGATVRFNGNDRSTTFVSSTQVNALILESDLAIAGKATVRVVNPEPGGGQSGPLEFTISTPSPVPRISSINPAAVTAGDPGFTMTVNGSNLSSTSLVRFNGNPLPTSFVNNTQITAQVSAENIARPGTASITVFTPAPGGGNSNALSLTIGAPPNPAPNLSGLSPNVVTAGGPSFTLTVSGTNFVSGSVVRVNNQDRATTFVSATELRAAILAADIQNGGTASIRIFNSAPGGGLSNELPLAISFIAPAITILSPSSAVAGGQPFTLSVSGTNFAPGSVVRWNGQDRVTNYLNVVELSAQIPAADIVNVGTADVTVFSPVPGGGLSNAVTFTITQSSRPTPRITSVSPDHTLAGGPAFILTVNGQNFVSDSVVRWNNSPRLTTFVNSGQLTAQISASDIAAFGSARVTVLTPPAGGGESNPLTFAINTPPSPVPVITSVIPGTVVVGSQSFVLTVNGSGFIAASTVQVNGENRQTTFIGVNQLTVPITAAEISTVGTLAIRVVTPSPGGGTSNEVMIAVVNPVPSIVAINPGIAAEGSPGFMLAVTGTGFVPGSEVLINGNRRATVFVSGTQLNAQILASDVATVGTLNVQVATPEPGGGISNVLALEVRKTNPIPRVTGISPDTVNAGEQSFMLVVNGLNFVRGSIVRVNGQDRPTEFVSETVLAAQILTADVAVGGILNVSAFTPAPGGGRSNSVPLTVNNPRPRITSISPDNTPAGSPGFTLIVNGLGFIGSSIVRFNGIDVPTTLVTATQLSAQIPAGAVVEGDMVPVAVFNPEPGGGVSNALAFTINNVAPVITGLNPDQVVAGSSSFTLMINGNRFVSNSAVRVNGQDRQSMFINSTQLITTIQAAEITGAGSISVMIINPDPGGGTSNTMRLIITAQPNPVPTITSLSPNSIAAGSAALTLTVNGANFVPGAVVNWSGAARQTTFINSTQLTAQIPSTDLASVGMSTVTVSNPAPGGGTSNALTFSITPPNPVPVLSSLNPAIATAGSPSFTLMVKGTGFVNSSVVLWNGSPRQTVFIDDTQLTAQITAADVVNVGTAGVTVFTPAPGGGTSSALTFTITAVPNPVPALVSLNPNAATEEDEAFTLTVTGANFVAGSSIYWNGSPRPTIFIDGTQLAAQISREDVANSGSASVTVFNPAPGGGQSSPLVFTINPLTLNCDTVCLRSAAYYSINSDRLPRGSVLIGGVNFNKPILIQNHIIIIQSALNGGLSPLEQLNQQFVATQLSLASTGRSNSEIILNSRLRCYGVSFDPVRLGNGLMLSRNTLFGDLLEQARLAIVDDRTEDMVKLTTVFRLLNGDDPSGRCQ